MNTSVIYLFARMLLGMGIVIAIMALAARYVQRKRAGSGLLNSKQQSPHVKVISRHTLAKGSHLVLVAVGEQTLLLGLHSSGVSLLGKYRPGSTTSPTQSPALGEAGTATSAPRPTGARAAGARAAGARAAGARAAGAADGLLSADHLATDEDDITVAARKILEGSDLGGQGRTPSPPMAFGLRRSAWTATLEQLRELTLRRS
jgi:flagellar biogenesis protein FliO